MAQARGRYFCGDGLVGYAMEVVRLEMKTSKHHPFTDKHDFSDDNDITLLARCVWAEARGEIQEARVGVAWSIKNRCYKGKWWGNTVREVILKPWQYSSFNHYDRLPKVFKEIHNDPNYHKLMNPLKYDVEAIWHSCYDITENVLSGQIPDNVGGSTHYYDDSITKPFWAARGEFRSKIGKLNFYYLEA